MNTKPLPGWAVIAIGAVGGTAWAASMRGMMAQLAGSDSEFHWLGTFGFILIPGTAMGALLGWAFARRIRRIRRGSTWLVLAPFAMAGDPSTILLLAAFVGAGFVFSGRSRRWLRLLAGIPSLIMLVGVPIGAAFFTDVVTPHGAWLVIQLGALIWVPALAEVVLQWPQREGSFIRAAGAQAGAHHGVSSGKGRP